MAVKELWDKTKFLATSSTQKTSTSPLKVVQCPRLMYRHGEFREHSNESFVRELRDPKDMIPMGSELRHWLNGKDYEPTHFRQWCELLMLYRANMAVRTTQQVVVEPGRLAALANDENQETHNDDGGVRNITRRMNMMRMSTWITSTNTWFI